MVLDYYHTTQDSAFLAKVLPSLDKEYQFWMTKRMVTIEGPDGKRHTLNQYNAFTTQPRPESFAYASFLYLCFFR
jgi:alpha,alpha-trehalase